MKKIRVIIAKFNCHGNNNQLRDLTIEEIQEWKSNGWLVKQQLNNYRPGFYTTKKQFLHMKGINY